MIDDDIDDDIVGPVPTGASPSALPDEVEGTYDASDPVQVQRAKTKAGREARQKRDVVEAIMSTPSGRLWMHGLLVECHAFATSFSRDALQMAFNEGERNIGIFLLTQIGRYPDLYMAMMRERPKING